MDVLLFIIVRGLETAPCDESPTIFTSVQKIASENANFPSAIVDAQCFRIGTNLVVVPKRLWRKFVDRSRSKLFTNPPETHRLTTQSAFFRRIDFVVV